MQNFSVYGEKEREEGRRGVKGIGHGWMTIVVERYFQIGWNGKKKEETEEKKGSYRLDR